MKYKVYLSFDHGANYDGDKNYRDEFMKINDMDRDDKQLEFIDRSIGGDKLDDSHSDKEILTKIRKGYLLDSSVTIVLIGKCTRLRRNIDYELAASMNNDGKNKRSGIVLITLPGFEDRSYFSERMIKNLDNSRIKIPVLKWEDLGRDLNLLNALISANAYKETNRYDGSVPLRKVNGECSND